jgi:methionine-gamma-lyase
MSPTDNRSTVHALETRAVHAGRDDLAGLGVHAPPLDLSSTYPLQGLEEGTASLDEMLEGGRPRGSAIYARLHNPTVARFENALAELEGAAEAVAFSSGMAALTACLMVARQKGGHVVAVRPLYGGSDHLLASGMLGLTVSWATEDTVAQALRPDTALVLVETPANPTLKLTDIRHVVAQAGGVPVLVDSTFATPVLQNPVAHGATLVLHSATKFLGGHGDVVAGAVACDAAWGRALRQVRALTGSILHPLAGYLLHRGLPTLALRVRAAQEGAAFLAERLVRHPAVARVHFPGLPGQDARGLVGRQLRGPGSLLAFELHGGHAAAAAVMGRVRLMTPAVSLGSVDTLIQHPAGLTHRVVDAAAREAHGISAGMLRVSVGIEHPQDLWADLGAALDAVAPAAPASPTGPTDPAHPAHPAHAARTA